MIDSESGCPVCCGTEHWHGQSRPQHGPARSAAAQRDGTASPSYYVSGVAADICVVSPSGHDSGCPHRTVPAVRARWSASSLQVAAAFPPRRGLQPLRAPAPAAAGAAVADVTVILAAMEPGLSTRPRRPSRSSSMALRRRTVTVALRPRRHRIIESRTVTVAPPAAGRRCVDFTEWARIVPSGPLNMEREGWLRGTRRPRHESDFSPGRARPRGSLTELQVGSAQ